MNLYSLMARLLDYPDEPLQQHLGTIGRKVELDESLSIEERKDILSACLWMSQQPLMRWQEEYVQTFDMTPQHSLHLTHHSFGDDPKRGPALVELGEFYKESGFTVNEGELPDYLPLILEFVASLDELGATVFLAQMSDVLDVLATNLNDADSPYATLIRLIERRGRLAQAAA